MDDLRFPVGRFEMPANVTDEQLADNLDAIEQTPAHLARAIEGLNDEQLDTPYRPDGWTVRQVVHHLPDSHVNSYVRMKLALTEDEPTILPYMEAEWAKLPDSAGDPLVSCQLLDSLHRRWLSLLRSLDGAQLDRCFRHPEMDGTVSMRQNIVLYGWHGRHHVAHITRLRERMGWS